MIETPALPDDNSSTHRKTGEGLVHLRHVWKAWSLNGNLVKNGKTNLRWCGVHHSPGYGV